MSIASRMGCIAAIACTAVSCVRLPSVQRPSSEALFDVPRLRGIVLDGAPGDWGDNGFRIDVLHAEGARKPLDDFDATVRLGWDERGLLVLVTVADDVPLEDGDTNGLWRRDSIELFVADAVGSRERWQAIIAPGTDPRHPDLRSRLYDYRASEELKKTPVAIEAARRKTAAGYTAEVLLPWRSLGIVPLAGRELGFQVYVNDVDGGPRSQLRWFPRPNAQRDTRLMHRLRLAKEASSPVAAAASGRYERFRRTRIDVGAARGKRVQVLEGNRLLGEEPLVPAGRLATASVVLPMPPRGSAYRPLTVAVDGERTTMVKLPDPEAARADAFKRAGLRFRPFVFSGEAFPAAQFDQPSLIEDAIGPYTLKTTFYDAGYNEVAMAAKPGRYGAIVEVHAEGGRVDKRFFTLFRQPRDLRWWRTKLKASVELPPELGIDAEVARAHSEAVADFMKGAMASSFEREEDGAVLLAGLFETKPGAPAVDRTGPRARNTSWWHELKRRTGDLVPLRYLVHLPPGAAKDKAKLWPTILFLHGAGERGDNLKLVEVHGPPKIVKTRPDFPFIVVSPQCPRDQWWQTPALNDLFEEMMREYPIDPDRIYLTGLSMGGFGSWAFSMEYPDRFAAVVPICGGGDPRDVERIKGIPAWVFHGGKDGVVPLARSEEMVEALRAVGGRVKLTVDPEAGHDSWSKPYASDELYDWFLQQRRGAPREPQGKSGE